MWVSEGFQYPTMSSGHVRKMEKVYSKIFGALLADLSKAFDCLNHELLIAKLKAYGFSLTALKLVHNYLSFGFSYPSFHCFLFFLLFFYLVFSWKSSVSFIAIVVLFNKDIVSFYFSVITRFVIFFPIIWILRLIFILIIRCLSWLNVSNVFVLINLRCCNSLWSSILTAFIILLWMFLDALFHIASHFHFNCLLLVDKAKLNLMFRPYRYSPYMLYVVRTFLCNYIFFVFITMLNSDISICFTIFEKDDFLNKIQML